MRMFLCLLAVWGSTSAAVSVALYYTHDMRCLWFLCIPALIKITFDGKDDDKHE